MHTVRPLLALAIATLISSSPSLADPPCSGSGTTVVTDPAGDIGSTQHDVTAIRMAEVFGGTHAGRFRVTLELSASEPPGPETHGLWIIEWQEFDGDSSLTLNVQRCQGVLTAAYTWQSADASYSESGAVDDLQFTAGAIEIVLSRDKFGDPPPGSTLTSIQASSIVTESLEPLLGCLPALTSPDATGSGTYTMGSCVVSVPLAAAMPAISLGPALPNPARRGVRLALDLPASIAGEPIEISVFDAAGRQVRSLAREGAAPGSRSVEWNLRADSGRRVPPGTYWLRVRARVSSVSRAIHVID